MWADLLYPLAACAMLAGVLLLGYPLKEIPMRRFLPGIWILAAGMIAANSAGIHTGNARPIPNLPVCEAEDGGPNLPCKRDDGTADGHRRTSIYTAP